MAHRPGLGRGLDALIPGGEIQTVNQNPGEKINQLDVNKITTNPRQPRLSFNDNELEELAASIKEHGIIQPLIVTPSPIESQYILIAGERRLRAANLLNLQTVPCIIRSSTQQELIELALIENVQREDLNPLEKAEAYYQLSQDFSITHEDIAKRVGKSRVSVSNTLRLLNLSEKVKNSLREGVISEGHARALLSLNTPRAQDAALDTIIKQDLNVRQAENLIAKLSGKKPKSSNLPELSTEFKHLEDHLRAHLKTKVKLQHGEKGGSITIFYYSDEELNTIISRISPEF